MKAVTTKAGAVKPRRRNPFTKTEVAGDEDVVRYNYRAYPAKVEKVALNKALGSCIVAHNDYLRARQEAYKAGEPSPSYNELANRLITEAKKTEERAWLSEVSPVPLQQALMDAQRAYDNFFSSRAGKRKGKKVGFPKRKKFSGRRTARYTKAAKFKVKVTGPRAARLYLPRVGWVPFVLSRPLPSEASSVTVIREPDGRYFFSFVVRVKKGQGVLVEGLAPCGIDVGLKTFATLFSREEAEDGSFSEKATKLEAAKHLRRRMKALRRSQRSLSRKQKGSKNRDKAHQKVARLHSRAADARADYVWQVANMVVDQHSVIFTEGLEPQKMACRPKPKPDPEHPGKYLPNGACYKAGINRAFYDTGLGMLLRIIADLGERRGRYVISLPRSFPSTQLCSNCHARTGPRGRAGLKVRYWTCTNCGASHDRDVNAARNILAEGLKLLQAAGGRPEALNACLTLGKTLLVGAQGETQGLSLEEAGTDLKPEVAA
jgi:putative transposase